MNANKSLPARRFQLLEVELRKANPDKGRAAIRAVFNLVVIEQSGSVLRHLVQIETATFMRDRTAAVPADVLFQIEVSHLSDALPKVLDFVRDFYRIPDGKLPWGDEIEEKLTAFLS